MESSVVSTTTITSTNDSSAISVAVEEAIGTSPSDGQVLLASEVPPPKTRNFPHTKCRFLCMLHTVSVYPPLLKAFSFISKIFKYMLYTYIIT